MLYHKQTAEFIATVAQNMPEISDEVMQNWIENPRGLQKFLAGLCPCVHGPDISAQRQLQEWDSFYKKRFGLTIGDVAVPDHQPGFDRLIVVANGLTLNRVYDACQKQFKCWRYKDDLDKDVATNDRDPANGTYAIWVRDRQEADEENKNLSADQLATRQVNGTTLMERMLYELKYFDETGNHLDIRSATLCSGSRDSGGDVPNAHWCDGEFGVGWGRSGRRDGGLRARSVVSLPTESR
ncbi:MAG: hypothetical protein HY005_03515 [Candidatus Staskawiczbacteria bacterium]|nr:hypothetical protein [Candidatus Staskawiczbacteria bacterium]